MGLENFVEEVQVLGRDLVDKVRDLIHQGIEERYRWVNELAEKLTPAERIQISEALDIRTRAARDLEAEPVH